MLIKKKIRYLAFILCIIVLSCAIFNVDIPNSVNNCTQNIIIPTKTAENLPVYELFNCVSHSNTPEIGVVTRVIDGDSIVAEIDGGEFEIRYIGINTPEYYSSEREAAVSATLENSALVKGKKIFLFRDSSNMDKFGRLLRYVFTEEYFINFELVKHGFAESKSYPPDTSCQRLFDQEEK